MSRREQDQLIAETCATLRAALQAGPSATDDQSRTSKALLKEAAARVRGEVSKLTLIYCQGTGPSLKDLSSLLAALLQHLLGLSAVLQDIVQPGCGPTLAKATQQCRASLFKDSILFVESLKGRPGAAQLQQLAGKVFERCKAAEAAALSDAIALARHLALALRQLQDADREATELSQSEAACCSDGDSADEPSPAAVAQEDTAEPSSNGVHAESHQGNGNSTARHNGANVLQNGSPDQSGAGQRQSTSPAEQSPAADPRASNATPQLAQPDQPPPGQQPSHQHLTAQQNGAQESGAITHHAPDAALAVQDLDFAPSPLNSTTAVTVKLGAAVVKCTACALEEVVRQLLQQARRGKAEGTAAFDVEAWESVRFHCDALVPATNDFMAGLYDPEDVDQLRSTLAATEASMEVIASELAPDGSDCDSGGEAEAHLASLQNNSVSAVLSEKCAAVEAACSSMAAHLETLAAVNEFQHQLDRL